MGDARDSGRGFASFHRRVSTAFTIFRFELGFSARSL